MNKLVSLVSALALFSNVCFADCDFSTGVKENPDGSRTYTKECHIRVGELVQDNQTKDNQIQIYKSAIELKDLAITKADERTQNWMDTSLKLEQNIQTMDSLKSHNEWLYFGLGVLSVFAAGMAAASLTNRH